MTSTLYELSDAETEGVSSYWLSHELSRAQSYLNHVNHTIVGQQQQAQDDNDEQTVQSQVPHDITPQNVLSKLNALSNQVECLSIASDYLDAVKNASCPNGCPVEVFSMPHLLALEYNLGNVVHSYNKDNYDSNTSLCSEFQEIYDQVKDRYEKIQRHIRARALLDIRKMLKDIAYPSESALRYILSEISSAQAVQVPPSDFKTTLQVIQKMGVDVLATELARPIVYRVEHHFIKSEVIPREKILKIPHLIFTYLRHHVIPHVAPLIVELKCEVQFYGGIHALVQHVLFQRGYFEKMGSANTLALGNFLQDVLKYDNYVLDNVREECWFEMSTLTDKLICTNSKLFRWWVKAERKHALTTLDQRSKDTCCDAIVSTAEVFHSLIHSQRSKIFFIRKRQDCRTIYLQQVVLPSCMHYLNILHKRATALRSAMDESTIYDLSTNSAQWIMLIRCTEQAARYLKNQDVDGGEPRREMNTRKSKLSELHSLSESFEKFSVAMVEECAQRLVDILMERSTFSSFLMTAGHLLSNGYGFVHSDGMEDVCMILSMWKGDVIDSMTKSSIKNRILEKVCSFLEHQLLEIVLDESLDMTPDGCRAFSNVVSEILKSINGGTQHCGRLGDVCTFMSQMEKFREPLLSLLGKEYGENLDIVELENDGTLYSEVENMLRGKAFSYLSVNDAFSLMNRIKTK